VNSGRRGLIHTARSSLVIRFGVVSALIILVLAAAFARWSDDNIKQSNLDRAQTVSTFGTNLAASIFDTANPDVDRARPENLALAETVIQAASKTGVFVGSTSWTSAHLVVQAEDGRLSHVARARPQVDAALRGGVQTLLVKHADPSLLDPTETRLLAENGPLIEVFVPISFGELHLVIQTFAPWAPVARAIHKQIRTMLLLVGVGTLVLWASLFQLVFTASRRLRRQAETSWHLAAHDALTELPNRILLADRVMTALARDGRTGRHTALLLIDLDRFKEINDTLGHRYGDLLLRQIGPRLEPFLRQADSISRLGGDEFVVLMSDLASPVDAETAAARILQALIEPFLLDGVSVDVEASIGIAVSPEHGSDFDTLLQHADVGMYQAKALHTGVAVYSAAGDVHSPERLALLGDLRRAMSEPDQLVLHYQPQLELANGTVFGVEALIRWHHPVQGLLAPEAFIPAAERTGLIRPLTVLVLRQALAQGRTWREQGLAVTVAVNVSTRCLLDLAFPETVRELLQEHGTPAGDLEIEITESAVMADPQRAIAVLTQLHELGVVLSIDDFGTGYSSMAYLKQLPVDRLKIDRMFVTDMAASTGDAAIVHSSIELAHNLGLSVIAEGVETLEAWQQLDTLGCDAIQGYHLARPMPASEVLGWMSTLSAGSPGETLAQPRPA
jgi:diguanylate cyclase (GGDEF)-like protein